MNILELKRKLLPMSGPQIPGGGGGGGQTTSTSYTSNIPEYARPYVDTMLGATQNQLFNTTQHAGTPDSYDDQGNLVKGTGAYTEITGFKPYQAYGGTYDDQGRQLSYDPSKAIAGFSPMQQQAQTGIMGMGVPGQFETSTQTANYLASQLANQSYGPSQFQKYQMNGIDDINTGRFDKAAADQYMNPYMQGVVDIQKREANRQAQQMASQNAAKFAGAGAFGGSRQAISMAEADRNLAQQLGDIQATGSNQAWQQAQQQFNADQARQLAVAQGNQAKNLSMGQTNLQALLNTQAQQEQARQFGANYGLQSQQAALGAARDAANYGQMGLQAQKDIYGLQNQVGAQQQAREQQIINQAMTDYANAQQYPLMQLGTMSNMLRGLPMQAQTTSQYAAAPNAITQGIGAAGAAASLYNATKGASGGLPSEFEYASGGIVSYNVGGQVESQLEDMDIEGLKREAKESSSPRIKQMAQRLLAEKQMAQAPRMAGGGIIAFSKGEEVEDKLDGIQLAEATQARDPRVVSDADGILLADATPRAAATKPAPAPTSTPAPAAKATPLPAPTPQGIVPNVQKDLAEHQAVANKSIEDIMAERQALRESLGVGTNKPQEDFRASVMAERANLKDEAERQRNMRLAEFFASWGSTPGPVLVAGMSALKKSIPGMVEDQKEAKKLQRESDKILYDIDNATRLEKLGRIDEAVAIKEKAATHAQALNKDLLHYAGVVKTAEAHSANAAATRDAAAATRAASLESKAQEQYRGALAYQNNVMAEIAREKTNKEYLKLQQEAKMPATAKGVAAKMRDDAIAKLEAIEKEHDDRIAEAKKNVEYFATRAGVPEAKAKKAEAAPEAPKVERPDWVPEGAKKADDGNWYVPNGNKGYKKVVKE